MSNRATIRLTASADGADAIGQLERATKLARDLEAIGFRVTLSGDVYIDARMVEVLPGDEGELHIGKAEPDGG